MKYELNSEQDWQDIARRADWSVDNLAGLYGVSTRTLERSFLENHNTTPEAWLTELRWRKALALLRGGASIKATSMELGYRQASSFSRAFKKRFGQRPTEFENALPSYSRPLVLPKTI